MAAIKVTFQPCDASKFVAELKLRVAEYFESRHLSEKADWRMVFKTICMLTLTWGTYALIMTNWFSPLAMLGLAIVMGVGLAGTGFSVSHDALHGAYSHNPKINKVIGYTFDLMGANGYMWKITHNVIHHTYTNICGIDEDLDVSPLIRLGPGVPRQWFHRAQHLYAWAAYSTSTLFWFFVKDFKYFLKKDLGPYKDKKHPKGEVISMLIMKAVFFTYTIVLPLMFLKVTWWQYLIGFLAMNLTAGLILGVIFQLAHVVEGTEYPAPDSHGVMDDMWIVHEMRTTSNFARKNHLLSWYVGGLNYQVEHHLYPKTCSVHYPAIAPIVQEVCEKYGVPYNQHETLFKAMASHYRSLKKLGHPEPGETQAGMSLASA